MEKEQSKKPTKKENISLIGNQWWKLRTKHGRDKIFSTPEILWDACVEYFEATDKRKWNKVEFKGSPLKEVSIPTDTPYTLTGLYIFLGIGQSTWNDYKNKEDYKDFSVIIKEVENIIYTQKFEGAVVGAYNSNIIARDLGLVDKKEIENTNIKPIEFTIIRKTKEEN